MSTGGSDGRGPLLTLHHPSGQPIEWGELDFDYLQENGIAAIRWEQPMRLALEPRTSHRGNTFYSCECSGLPLPDGLDTALRIDRVPFMEVSRGKSKRGNPTVRLTCSLELHSRRYEATAFLTRGRRGLWIKVHAQASPMSAPREANAIGARFV